MSMFDRLPFWKRYFAELGLETVLSPVTDPRISAGGIELSVAEPCYPVQVAHGHVQALIDGGCGLRLAAGDGGRGGGRGRLRVALLPVEPDAAVGAEIGAGAGGARSRSS